LFDQNLAAANARFYANPKLGFAVVTFDESLCEQQLPDGIWNKILQAAGPLLSGSSPFLIPRPPERSSQQQQFFMTFYKEIKATVELFQKISPFQRIIKDESGELGAPIFSAYGSLLYILTKNGLLEWSKVKDELLTLSSGSFEPLTKLAVKTGAVAFKLRRAPLVEPGVGVACYRATVFRV
jgi:hypothetical protein